MVFVGEEQPDAKNVDIGSASSKGTLMTNMNDPNRRTVRTAQGMSGSMMAGIAIAAMIAVGFLVYTFSGNLPNTARMNSSATEQSTPPATTGQRTETPATTVPAPAPK
jgi:hypothetical protein